MGKVVSAIVNILLWAFIAGIKYYYFLFDRSAVTDIADKTIMVAGPVIIVVCVVVLARARNSRKKK